MVQFDLFPSKLLFAHFKRKFQKWINVVKKFQLVLEFIRITLRLKVGLGCKMSAYLPPQQPPSVFSGYLRRTCFHSVELSESNEDRTGGFGILNVPRSARFKSELFDDHWGWDTTWSLSDSSSKWLSGWSLITKWLMMIRSSVKRAFPRKKHFNFNQFKLDQWQWRHQSV